MDNTVKIWLIVGAALVILGLVIFAIVMTVNHWDFSKLSTVRYMTNTHTLNVDFTDIFIETNTAELLFVPSDDGTCKVVCHESEKERHSVTVQDGVLTIQKTDTRKWYDHIGISWGHTTITLYLPQSSYQTLTVNSSTGDVTLPKEFGFESMDVAISTGHINTEASVSGIAKLKTSTGDICVKGITAETLDLSVSTGKVTVSDVTCNMDVSIGVSTGKVRLTNLKCNQLVSQGTTGDITLTNVVAANAFSITRSTGDVRFDKCDAGQIAVKTSTGNVTGSLLSDKIFITQTGTGKINVPKTTAGGRCDISTDTGDIKLQIEA